MKDPVSVRLTARLYRVLLRLAPAALVRRHGAEMVELQRQLAREARVTRGVLGPWVALVAATGDVLRQRAESPPPVARRRARPGAALRQDAVFALRHLWRNPGYAALGVLTLGLGIGAATAIFGVVDAVVLRPLPFQEPERLIRVDERTPRGEAFSLSAPNYLDLRAAQRTFTSLAAYSWGNRVWQEEDEVRTLHGLKVTHDFFATLGIRPVTGRIFGAEEDRQGGDTRVALLSTGFWERAFGGDPGVVGRSIALDGVEYRVVGVVPADPSFLSAEVYTPLAPDPGARRGNHMVEAVGRLAPGVSIEQARADLAAIARELESRYPDSNAGWGVRLVTAREDWIGPRLERLGLVVLGAAGLLLLMACASVSNLLLARAAVRRHELSLRAALGAPRTRLLRQLLLEGGALAGAGAVLGLGLSAAAMPAIRALGPTDLPRLAAASVDIRALGFAAGAAIATVLLAALLPALFATRSGPGGGLRELATPTATPARRRLRSGLVALQVAVAVTLLLASALLTRSFDALRRVDLGFAPEQALRFRLHLPEDRYDDAARVRLVSDLEEKVAALGSVVSVGTTMGEPFGDFRAANFVAAGDAVPDRAEDFLPVSWRAVTPGFFDALEVRRLGGRLFDTTPPGAGPLEVVVDEKLARTLWPDRSAVGETLVWNGPDGPRLRVVGVVATVRDETLEQPRPRVYLSYAAFPWSAPALLVRFSGDDPGAAASGVRAALHELDPRLPADPPVELTGVLSDVVAWPRFSMQVVGAFSVTALLLATVGLAGVVAFLVRTRTREIGVRLALGASPRGVVWMMVRSGLLLTLSGVGAGIAVALAAARLLEGLLYGVAPTDAVSVAATAGVVLAVSLLATCVPSLAAASVDPKRALVVE